MDQGGVEVHKLTEKKERGQYPAISTEQAWSIKDSLYGLRGRLFCRTQRVISSRQDSSILPTQVANHCAEFDLSCPLALRRVVSVSKAYQRTFKITIFLC